MKATVPRSRGISQLNLTDGLISWRNRPRGSLLACDLPEAKSSCHGAKRDSLLTRPRTYIVLLSRANLRILGKV